MVDVDAIVSFLLTEVVGIYVSYDHSTIAGVKLNQEKGKGGKTERDISL